MSTNATANLPSIIVSETEQLRLSNLATAALLERRSQNVADTLLTEMDRADVVPDSHLPANVVRMNSVVDCEIDGKSRRAVQLVFPGMANFAEGTISILTPVGAALIGLSAGQTMSWSGPDGRRHSVSVIAVREAAMTRSQVKQEDGAGESELIRRAARKEEAAIRAIIQANNSRLYRVARAIVRDDGEAEDVLQEAYIRAFSAIADFRGESRLATWLTRIVINEALQHVRRRKQLPAAEIGWPGAPEINGNAHILSAQEPADPERLVAQREICRHLERAIDALPDEFRTVLVARVIEDMSIDETADLLGIRPETVKTRLHRARRHLKNALGDHIGPLCSDVFPFAGRRCQGLTDAVINRLDLSA